MPTDPPRVSVAITWAFDTFKRYPIPFIALAAVVAVIQTMLNLATQPFVNVLNECAAAQTSGQQLACESAVAATVGGTTIAMIVLFIAGVAAQVGVLRGALAAARGQQPEFSLLWSTQNLGRYIGTLLLVAVLVVAAMIPGVVLGVAVGLMFGLVIGVALGALVVIAFTIVVSFLLQLATIFALDRGLTPGAAMSSSIKVIGANLGPAILMVLFSLLVNALSGAFWGLLTLLTLPFVTLFMVHMYRQFTADSVA